MLFRSLRPVGLAACLACELAGQTPAGPERAIQTPLPRWLHLGGQLSTRLESSDFSDPAPAYPEVLNRLRLNVNAQPTSWFRAVVQLQDARATAFGHAVSTALRDPLDVRLAYAEAGRAESGWLATVGRQELAIGDERLVGSDNQFGVFGPSFDAIKISRSWPDIRVSAFAGYLVSFDRRRPDRHDKGSRLVGLSAEWKIFSGSATFQPYVLWKRLARTFDHQGRPGHRDVVSPGFLLNGTLSRGINYAAELALQRGHVAASPHRAWASHTRAGWKWSTTERSPRVTLSFDYTSGSERAHPGGHATFDELYQAGSNKYGVADPFAWRNLAYPAVDIELPLARRLLVSLGLRSYWLATRRDALYLSGETVLAFNPGATSSHVGLHAFAAAQYRPRSHVTVYAGYTYLARGAFLRQNAPSRYGLAAYLVSVLDF